MKKYTLLLALLISFSATAEIISGPQASITLLTGYDDYISGGVMLALSQNHASCPVGAYINPSSPGAKTLVALALSAFLGSKQVVVQLYTDRQQAGRCEIDAIAILP